jgi:hypothetical protein
MNGSPRDGIWTDLIAGRPAISPGADALARQVADLMSVTERTRVFDEVTEWARASAAFATWLVSPASHLSELDSEVARAIEDRLRALHADLLRRAKERGWEITG